MRLSPSACFCLSSAVAILALSSPALRADTVTNVSGTIPSAIYAYDGTTVIAPSSLSGTITIDQTADTINTDVFLTGGIVDEYTSSSYSTNYFNSNVPDIFAFSATSPDFSNPAGAFAILDLEIPDTAFSATGTIPLITAANASIYEPGAQITTVSNVGQGEGQNIDLTAGNLTAATDSPVPEPSSLILLCTGIGALGAGLRRNLRRA